VVGFEVEPISTSFFSKFDSSVPYKGDIVDAIRASSDQVLHPGPPFQFSYTAEFVEAPAYLTWENRLDAYKKATHNVDKKEVI
jgi:hypothetical protein